MSTTRYNIDRIKTIDILQVARDLGVNVKRSGHNYKALCPFHGDRSIGSFILYPKSQSCYCYSCQKSGSVIDYYMAVTAQTDFMTAVQELGDKYLNGDPNALKPPTKKQLPQPQTLHLSRQLMMSTIKYINGTLRGIEGNTLLQYLATIFPRHEVERTAYEYLVGTTKNGGTIFWNMAFDGTVRTGKVIRYHTNGHRYKTSNWIHSMMLDKNDEPLPQWKSLFPSGEWKMVFTLFGEHLLHDPARRHLPVAIVESEKTALIAAMHFPSMLWLATGGKTYLNEQRLAAIQLQHRDIYLVPDRDALHDTESKDGRISQGWPSMAEKFSYRDHIKIADDAETLAQELGVTDPKCDVGDLFIIERQRANQSQQQS